MSRVYCLKGFQGLVEERRNRLTKTMIGLYHGVQSGIENDPETPWVTVCEDHGSCVCHPTLALARSHMAVPEWCEECQEIMYPERCKTDA